MQIKGLHQKLVPSTETHLAVGISLKWVCRRKMVDACSCLVCAGQRKSGYAWKTTVAASSVSPRRRTSCLGKVSLSCLHRQHFISESGVNCEDVTNSICNLVLNANQATTNASLSHLFDYIGVPALKCAFQLQRAPNKDQISGRWHGEQVLTTK